jgi:hypothetical protein
MLIHGIRWLFIESRFFQSDIIHEIRWLFMVDYSWNPMIIHGIRWLFMESDACSWNPMLLHGIRWLFIKSNACSWNPMLPRDASSWNPMITHKVWCFKLHGIRWLFMLLHGICCCRWEEATQTLMRWMEEQRSHLSAFDFALVRWAAISLYSSSIPTLYRENDGNTGRVRSARNRSSCMSMAPLCVLYPFSVDPPHPLFILIILYSCSPSSIHSLSILYPSSVHRLHIVQSSYPSSIFYVSSIYPLSSHPLFILYSSSIHPI